MFCSISGKPTALPVLSPVSGHIFDETLVENYIEETGKDPINDQPLSVQDLIKVNRVDPAIAIPNNLTSIPNLLSQFQKEWDALAVELFTLRKQLKQSREELSVLLYQNDAAVRVAARAIKERDEVKKLLEELSSSMAKGEYNKVVVDDDDDVKVVGEEDDQMELTISDEISAEIKKAHSVLFNEHKTNKRKPIFNSDSKISLSVGDKLNLQPLLDEITGFKTAMITSVVPHPTTNLVLITFDNDHALVIDTETNTEQGKLTPKKKNLVSSNWLIDTPILAFQDGTISIDSHLIRSTKNLFKLITHPILPIFITVHKSGFCVFYNNSLIYKIDSTYEPTCLDLHGDGVLLGIGANDGSIYIYDISTGSQVLKLNESKGGKVNKLQFASNGYSLVAGFESSSLKIFDLRKEAVTFEIADVEFLLVDNTSHLIYLIRQTEDKIELSYLRYYKKQKTWKLDDDPEYLLIDEVHKLKKKQTTHVVGVYERGDQLVVLENSNQLKYIHLQLL